MNRKMLVLFLIFIVIVAAGTYLYQTNVMTAKGPQGSEGFWGDMPSMVYKVDNQIANDMNAVRQGDVYSTPGYLNFLSPRFDNTDHSANIRQRLPSGKMLASPVINPRGYDSMMASDDKKCENCVHSLPNSFAEDGILPLGEISVINPDGTTDNPIVVDRLIFANRTSRLRAGGDKIRGDVPIVPAAPGWFRPSVVPHIDLEPGAMNIIAGENSVSSRIDNLFRMSRTNYGANAGPISNQMSMSLGAEGADVKVEAYP